MGWCVEVENISAVWALVPTVDRREGGRKPPDLPREALLPRRVENEGSGWRAVWVQGQLELSLQKLGRKGEVWTELRI